jgi:putative hemolysin
VALFLFVSALFFWGLQAYFTMMEMASLSYPKLRFLSQKIGEEKESLFLEQLMNNPYSLFSTSLLGVNFSLVCSSECIRQLFLTMQWNSRYSIWIQLIGVLLCAELAPLFAARKNPEFVFGRGMRFFSLFSKILHPVSMFFEKIFHYSPQVTEKKALLTKEEIKNGVVEESQMKEIENNLSALFSFRSLKIKEILSILQVSSTMTHQHSMSNENTVSQALGFFIDHPHMPLSCVNAQNEVVGVLTYATLLDVLLNNKHESSFDH